MDSLAEVKYDLSTTLEYGFFDRAIRSRSSVSVYLKNGVRLEGAVSEQSRDCLVIDSQDNSLLVYKDAIASIKRMKDTQVPL